MNGKQCKKMRAIANSKAISWKETTTQGAKTWKSADTIYVDPRTSNFKDGVFFQRKLHPLSVGAIVKNLKGIFMATAKSSRRKSR